MKTMQKMQCGFSLISAIFLLVVIAALGAFAVSLSTTQQQSAALDVLGIRAYHASRAGIEWGAYQVLPNSLVAGGFAAKCQAPGGTSAVLATLPNTLANFQVQVGCTGTAVSEAGATLTMYQLTSTATTPGAASTPNYVERQISVTIAQPPPQ